MITTDKLTTVAENQQKVFEAGKIKEKNDFWDVFQMSGQRTDYQYAFCCEYGRNKNDYWNDNNFFPKYDITVNRFSFASCRITNLKQRLIDCGVNLIPSEDMTWAFRTTDVTHIPDLSEIAAENATYLFYNSQKLESIDGIRFSEDTTAIIPFLYDFALENITFYGTIAIDLSFRDSSKLSAESMKSIISCLKNYKGTSSANTKTITFHNTAWERLEKDSVSPTGSSWKDYVYNELGWNY